MLNYVQRRGWCALFPDELTLWHSLKRRSFNYAVLFVILFSSMFINAPLAFSASAVNALSSDWPTYLHDSQRSGATSDTTITANNAAQLAPKWTFKTGGGIASQPIIVGNTAYIGSWDGYEYALNATTGALQWKTFLGQTYTPACIPPTTGVTSTATVQNGIVYVGGGDRYWYALDASTGNVLWKVDAGDNSITGGHYNWSSPLVANGYAYIGVASDCDAPLVQGLLMKVDLSTHQVVGTLKLVPDGEIGGGIWTSPSLDTATNTIYVTTGTISVPTQLYAQAILAVNPTSMTVSDSWQIPPDAAGIDLDWGTTPVLFTDANKRQLVAASNKDGILYAFNRSNLAAGPVWQTPIALTGDCPPCGNGTVSTTAIGNNRIYIAGGNTSINGQGYPGAIRALDPATGNILWQQGTTDAIIPALTYSNGLVIDGAGSMFEVRNAATGNILYSYQTSGIYGAASISNGTIFDGALDGTVYAFGLSTPQTPPPDPNCPAGWTCQDLGNATPAGSETVKNGTWNVSAGGNGIGGTTDQYRSLTKNVTGDTQIAAKITALPVTAGAQTGIFVRQSTNPGSPYYAVFVQPNNTLAVRYRTAFGGNTIAQQIANVKLPLYLEIQRHGYIIQAASSTDGVHYTLISGSTISEVLPATAMVGLGSSSGVNGTLGNATFSNVVIGAPGTVTPPAPASPCPTTWTCGDVGNPLLVGDQSLNTGVWQMKAGGSGMNYYSDQFHYAWQAVNGNVTVTTHVTAQDNTDPEARAGVMLRQSTDPGSVYYGVFVTPGQGIMVQYRESQGENTEKITIPGTIPTYLRVSRWNTSFTAYTSNDGNVWTPIQDATQVLNFPSTLQAGIVASSQNGGVIGNVTMDTVSVTSSANVPPVLCPSGWSCADIANSVPAGNESLNNGTWTIRAGGSDIWSLYDQFHFDWQSLPGDGSISAHIVSLSNTDPWAKAGVALRQSADAAAPYYGAFVTTGNGLAIQYRPTQQGPSTQLIIPDTIPIYLKVARTGAIFSTYTSSDGVNWTIVPGSSVRLGLTGALTAGLAVTSHTTAALTTAVIDSVTIATTATPPATNCPATWSCADIGNPMIVGGESLTNGTWNIQGGGSDIWGTTDQFHYDWQSLNNNGAISAHVTSITNTDPWAKTGVMIRQSTDPASSYYAAFITEGNGVSVQYRSTSGAGTMQFNIPGSGVPAYLEVARAGTIFTAYTSKDGTTWTPIANSSVNIAGMTGTLDAGLAVTSHNVAASNNTTIDTVNLITNLAACPTAWTCADIGSPSLVGQQLLINGAWTIHAGGSDIWGTTDQFHYAWQTITADGTVSADVATQDNTDPWAKAGVMLRQSTDPGSPYYAIFVTPGNGVTIQYRSTQGGTTTQLQGVAGQVPVYLEVARSGGSFTAYTSNDGITWTPVANSTINLGLSGPLLAGLAVTSHNDSFINTVTLNAVNVATTAPPPPSSGCPNGWSCADIGTPTQVGTQAVNNGTWTLQGSGSDIWGTTDEFHYSWQNLTTDSAVSAHIATQSNTDPWAKAGVMLRQSTDPGSPYYAVFVTPGNGITVQYRAVQEGTTASINIAGSVPAYLKVSRSGTTFVAYTSQDGTTWTPIANSNTTITMAGNYLGGLAICSHNEASLGSVTFDTVVIG